ncbi:hypothetical protein AB0940_33490 [Streptomyces sp. NPDC006656]|uniref:hypothetical protein n=1 Tax=Streptomyces sp. NPDC006656 TaxID=3156899 RepID=UPI0034567DB9
MFGVIGSGGALLIICVALFLHKRGGGKLQPVKDHHVIYWGAALGILAAGAGEAFRQVGSVSTTFQEAMAAQSATVGTVGPAATAALLVLVGFGTKPAFFKDLIIGVAAPGALAAAGAMWALPVTITAALLRSVVGA